MFERQIPVVEDGSDLPIKENVEKKSERNPNNASRKRLPSGWDMGATVNDTDIDKKRDKYDREEGEPDPERIFNRCHCLAKVRVALDESLNCLYDPPEPIGVGLVEIVKSVAVHIEDADTLT